MTPQAQKIFRQMAKEKGYSDAQVEIALKKQTSTEATATATPTPTETSDQSGKHGVAGFAVGAAKGAGSTGFNLASFGKKILDNTAGRIANAVTGKGFTSTETQTDRNTTTKVKNVLKPKSTAERVGFGTEQVGEFLLPGGAISKAGKAAEAGVDAVKLAENAGRGAKLVKGVLKVGAKAAIEGAGAAGLTAAQGGSKSDVLTAGATGGIFSTVGDIASATLKKLPDSAWANILKRTSKQVMKNPNLPTQAAETGMVGSKASIVAQSKSKIQEFEVALDDLLKGSKQKIGTLKIAPYLDELRSSYKNIPGEEGSVETINNVMSSLLNKKSLTAVEANQMKRDIYKVIENSYGKGVLESPVKTAAQKQIAYGLKSEIEKIIPEAKSLNQKQAIYVQVKKAIERQLAQGEGRGVAGTGIGLYDLGTGALGGIYGFASGKDNKSSSTAAGIAAAIAGKKLIGSTLVASAGSKLLQHFIDLPPTKKLLFYEALKGLTVKSSVKVKNVIQGK